MATKRVSIAIKGGKAKKEKKNGGGAKGKKLWHQKVFDHHNCVVTEFGYHPTTPTIFSHHQIMTMNFDHHRWIY
jgi:hypothetical protein